MSFPSSIAFSNDPQSDLADPNTWRSVPASQSPECSILSSERVFPLDRQGAASAGPTTEWILSPSDWLMNAPYTIRPVLFYNAVAGKAQKSTNGGAGASADSSPAASTVEVIALPRLRRALQALLQAYPILCGRFVPQPNGTVTVVSDALDRGVPLVSMSIAAPLASLPFMSGPAAYKTQRQIPPWPLVTPFDYSNAVAEDVFTLTLSRFSCGSVALGCHMHHWLGDAEAIFTLLNDLSELYNNTAHVAEGGEPLRLKVQPHIDRSCMQIDPATVAELTRNNFEPTAYEATSNPKQLTPSEPAAATEDGLSAPAPTPVVATPPVRGSMWRVWRFGAAELAAIKSAASASSSSWVSTFEALTAHVIRCVMRARATVARGHAGNASSSSSAASNTSVSEDELCRVNLFVNFRPRLRSPPLPPKLFANGVLMAQARVSMSMAVSVDSSALGTTASVLHSTLESFTESAVRSTLAWVAAQENKSHIGMRGQGTQLIVTSWCKFAVYGVAFDGVHPTRVTFPFAEDGVDGIITLLDAPPSEAGAIDVYQGINHDTAVALERDPEWRQFRGQ